MKRLDLILEKYGIVFLNENQNTAYRRMVKKGREHSQRNEKAPFKEWEWEAAIQNVMTIFFELGDRELVINDLPKFEKINRKKIDIDCLPKELFFPISLVYRGSMEKKKIKWSYVTKLVATWESEGHYENIKMMKEALSTEQKLAIIFDETNKRDYFSKLIHKNDLMIEKYFENSLALKKLEKELKNEIKTWMLSLTV